MVGMWRVSMVTNGRWMTGRKTNPGGGRRPQTHGLRRVTATGSGHRFTPGIEDNFFTDAMHHQPTFPGGLDPGGPAIAEKILLPPVERISNMDKQFISGTDIQLAGFRQLLPPPQ